MRSAAYCKPYIFTPSCCALGSFLECIFVNDGITFIGFARYAYSLATVYIVLYLFMVYMKASWHSECKWSTVPFQGLAPLKIKNMEDNVAASGRMYQSCSFHVFFSTSMIAHSVPVHSWRFRPTCSSLTVHYSERMTQTFTHIYTTCDLHEHVEIVLLNTHALILWWDGSYHHSLGCQLLCGC